MTVRITDVVGLHQILHVLLPLPCPLVKVYDKVVIGLAIGGLDGIRVDEEHRLSHDEGHADIEHAALAGGFIPDMNLIGVLHGEAVVLTNLERSLGLQRVTGRPVNYIALHVLLPDEPNQQWLGSVLHWRNERGKSGRCAWFLLL